jgi:hypothetical protein
MSELPKQILQKRLLMGDESLLPPLNLFALAHNRSILFNFCPFQSSRSGKPTFMTLFFN